MKNYCNRCKKIDKECIALVNITMKAIEFHKVGVEYRDFWKTIGGFPQDLALCDKCIAKFFDHAKESKD